MAIAGGGSGVIDKVFSPQNSKLNLDNWYNQLLERHLQPEAQVS
ncbi:hypothetical protein PPEP_a3490 [Pseudoalteromonas peptidolytica F12-50-A1]|uniref:Uncharacterized protein n=1 Tax=Pseudoalteromonas peptidolytica F12-50-A1 TaxID=1315280 RepID=A0A8I0MTX3_9GAMM|nr:hypothetical protein [Pseudoalteromonas peptidolytica F12-50-A1]